MDSLVYTIISLLPLCSTLTLHCPAYDTGAPLPCPLAHQWRPLETRRRVQTSEVCSIPRGQPLWHSEGGFQWVLSLGNLAGLCLTLTSPFSMLFLVLNFSRCIIICLGVSLRPLLGYKLFENRACVCHLCSTGLGSVLGNSNNSSPIVYVTLDYVTESLLDIVSYVWIQWTFAQYLLIKV